MPERRLNASFRRTLITAAFAAACIAVMALSASAQPTSEGSQPVSANDDVLVGINYFGGWWEPMPNKWHDSAGKDWRPQYPGRVPKLGEYNTSATMTREIDAAADHGVDFFLMLWYYNEPGTDREPHSSRLNEPVRQFTASPNSSRMRFMLEFCNHPPFDVTTDEQWKQCLAEWTALMKHPSYLRVGGRPVFKVHGAHYFLKQNGSEEAARKQLATLRKAASEAGAGELLIGCGVGAAEPITSASAYARLFDFTATYMDVPPLEQRDTDYSYDALSSHILTARRTHGEDVMAYLPFLSAGWNPRPWGDPRPAFAFPDRKQWRHQLEELAREFDMFPNFGLPLPNGGRQKAFSTYAWNEYGEGGIVAPTQGDGAMKLEEIREVFGSDKEKKAQ